MPLSNDNDEGDVIISSESLNESDSSKSADISSDVAAAQPSSSSKGSDRVDQVNSDNNVESEMNEDESLPIESVGQSTQVNGIQDNSQIEDDKKEHEHNGNEETVTDDNFDEDEDNEDEESSSESDSSDSDSDSEEPKLKYSRLSNLNPPVFTKGDAVSAFLITETLVVFATHSGLLHLFNPDMTSIRSYRAHRASILSLSTDGHYLASGSLDGTVRISSILEQNDISGANFSRPIHAVALDPNYRNTKAFISAGTAGEVIYSEKNWFGKRSDTSLYNSENPIISVHWFRNLIIWMNEDGITLYSKSRKVILKQIERPPNSPRADLYKPRICFPDSNRIYIAWANHIWNIKVTVGNDKASKNGGIGASSFLSSSASVLSPNPDEIIEIENFHVLEWLISGILPFKDTVMVLTYAKVKSDDNTGKRGTPDPPELKLIDWATGEEVYADVLSMREYERLGLDDYHLGYFPGNNNIPEEYFIVSGKDAIIAQPRTLHDRIDWLKERKMFKKCWEMSGSIIDPITRIDIGINHVESLIDKDKWTEASMFLKLILSEPAIENKSVLTDEWNRWGWIFIRSDHIAQLAMVMPTDEQLEIKKELYDEVIKYCLENDKPMLIKLMYQWPTTIYDSNSLKNQLEDLINETEGTATINNSLRMALADLYTRTNDPLASLQHLLALHHITVIDHISKYHLLPQIHPIIPQVFTYNLSDDELKSAPLDIIRDKTLQTVKLFVDGRHQIVPEVVINKLSSIGNLDIILFLYLEELNKKDSFIAKGFGDLQVKLYAEFDRPQLIGFFSRNNNYSLNKALEICERNKYIPELVYLLGKVGQNQRALRLIIEKLNDPEQALEFAKSQNDKDLWNDLIHYSLKNPLFIKVLLEKGDGSIDPIRIIRDIPAKTKIPGLKEALLKLFKDKEILKSLNIGALDIIKDEARSYSQHLRTIQLKGDVIDFNQQYPNLDLSLPYVLTPDGTIKSELELIGKKVPSWVDEIDQDDNNKYLPLWSVARKVAHLTYILRNLATS